MSTWLQPSFKMIKGGNRNACGLALGPSTVCLCVRMCMTIVMQNNSLIFEMVAICNFPGLGLSISNRKIFSLEYLFYF